MSMQTRKQEMGKEKEITEEFRKKYGINTDPASPEPLGVPLSWRHFFPRDLLASVEKPHSEHRCQMIIERSWDGDFYGTYYYNEEEARELGLTIPNRRNSKTPRPNCRTSLDLQKVELDGTFDRDDIKCTCPKGAQGGMCLHKALFMNGIEERLGGLIVWQETEAQRDVRIATIQMKKLRKEELDRHKALGDREVEARTFFHGRKTPEGDLLYDMGTALQSFTTDAYAIDTAKRILALGQKQKGVFSVRFQEFQGNKKEKELHATLLVRDAIMKDHPLFSAAEAVLEGETLSIDARSGYLDGCGEKMGIPGNIRDRIDPYDEKKDRNHFLTANALVLCSFLWDEADALSKKAQDITDANAEKFFGALERAGQKTAALEKEQEVPRRKVVALHPRITYNDGYKLSFRISQAGGRAFILRNMQDLVRHYQKRTILQVTKKEQVDFAAVDFTDESKPLFVFLQQKVQDLQTYNDTIEQKNYYFINTLSLKNALDLTGGNLDGFYDSWSGKTVDYQPAYSSIESAIPVGHQDLRITLKTQRVKNTKGHFAGITVVGAVPQLLEGNGENRYILNELGLSRISEKDQQVISPFLAAGDEQGNFQFQVGYPYLQEFYYRVVPRLLENPGVDFTDGAKKDVEKVLPPEPAFTFYLDNENLLDRADSLSEKEKERVKKGTVFALTCRAKVSYTPQRTKEEKDFLVGVESEALFPRDMAQENRVEHALQGIMTGGMDKDGTWSLAADEERLYDFLQSDLSTLEEYGNVEGTEAFQKYRIRPVPVVRVGVSVESGLLDLSVTSHDLSEEDLLDALHSYERKKRFHRLRSGDFLDLQDDTQLSQIEELMNQMDVDPKEAIEKSAKIPLYRSLYLDRLLEDHNELVSSRDRVYRSLIRSFKTVRDAEVEPPKSLQDVLRPYQVYGFKWVETLEDAGFAGILADEMGLGKTLQMISVLLYDYENKKSGTQAPSLVVCPASLVFNWQEELEKFAPGLSVTPIAGGAAARREALAKWDATQVFVISYDLLKRNIAELSQKHYFYVILDEAQYIKNAAAAVSKAVKALKSEHRFALTGTPIENRLSEFWSIFDFLMPGFLYSAHEFDNKLGTPITKFQDEAATEKLKKMTAPFLLRRRKEDVLKDLPEKLEEVRYVPISGEQQKLYDAEVLKLKGEILEGGATAGGRVKVFAELTRIREICCDPSLLFENYDGESAKREAVLGLVHQAMDGGHRMLLFSQFTSMLALLEQDLVREKIPYFLLTGSTPKEKRIQLVHQFNEGDIPVFLISLKAGGTGLNLTGADVVIHYDPWWNLAAQNQATDRTHRIGQTKQVTVYRMIMKGTIEEKILQLQETKKDLAESVLSGDAASLSSLTPEELLALLS